MTHLGIRPDVLVDPRFDQHVRWEPGERLHHLFEAKVDAVRTSRGVRLAVDAEDGAWSYDELDERANQLARHLSRHGVRAGDRVGLLFDRAVDGYAGMLATLKLNAAYVPLDRGFPPDRLAYICHDAHVRIVVTCSALSPALSLVPADVLEVDADASAIAAEPTDRLTPVEREPPVDELAYIIYTSGSTGRPKGVAIEHASICNFVRVAAEVYGATAEDRFYQGMTIAFDFSVEEIWVPWMVGATLVPKPSGGALVGKDLSDFLRANRVTGLCCVPTLLATMEDVPELRFVLVSGEACPQDLIARWYRPDRRFLNVYGPTEATVTATWSTLDPGRPVTIGTPLPTYSVVILDPESDRVVPRGQSGEVCIGGVALSSGYVNRPDLTTKAFIQDSVGLPNNPSGRMYRTGDLGRIDEDGNIEYLGRIDLQVKIRGYRIELTEVESVLLQHPGIASAVVEAFRPDPETVELVAYYCRRGEALAIDPVEVQHLLRDRLPGYMVPAFFVELEKMPMLPSDKVDRKKLPPPDPSLRQGGPGEIEPPSGPVEAGLARILADILHVDEVGVTSHFFDDLGANSLLMARFCARVREQPRLGAPTMKDIYRHPNVRTLAAHLSRDAGEHAVGIPAQSPAGDPDDRGPSGHGVPTWQYVAIALTQTLLFALLSTIGAAITVFMFTWSASAVGLVDLYLRSVEFSALALGFLFALPLLAKWTLIGRSRDTEIPLWGLSYLRFWIVRQLTVLNPARLLAGTPILPWYLRLLGARIGRGVTIYSTSIPTFADLLTIGDGAVVLRGALFNCYRVEGGIIQSGRVTIGSHAFIGGDAILDIDTEVGDDAQLGHASCLLRGQRVPAGEHWHGSPAVPTGTDYRTVPDLPRRPLRGVLFGLTTILLPVAGFGPSMFVSIDALLPVFPGLADPLLSEAMLSRDYRTNLIGLAESLAIIPITLLAGLLVAFTVPRLVNLLVKPDTVYPLYGVRFSAMRGVRRLTNTPLTGLFGDSSYITWFLSWLGYKLRPVEQSGSNFGMAVTHDIPYLVRIGTGTMVSDGLSLMNAEYSSTAFRVRPTVVGKRNFIGNMVLYPPDAKVGDNCLLATKVLLPLDGEVRHDVGLLGSPAFEIPRSVNRDAAFDQLKEGPEHQRRLHAKVRYNTATIGWSLLTRWWGLTVITSYLVMLGLDLHHQVGFWGMALVYFSLPLVTTAYGLGVEWAALGFRRLRPQYCSLYDPIFWHHERYWKLGGGGSRIFAGTPYMGWVLRARGARIGRQFFNDGGTLVERSLTTVGDFVTINQGVTVQGHSLEDGTFKSGPMVLEDGCTLGLAAFVHYSTRVGPGAVIEAGSFLMKGEEVPAGQRWHGNPALPAASLASGSQRPDRVLAGRAPVLAGRALPVVEAGTPRRAQQPMHAATPAAPAARRALAPAKGTESLTEDPSPRRAQPRRAVSPAGFLEELRAGRPVVPAAGVEVYLLAVEACRDHADQLAGLLDPRDREALASMASPWRATRFAAARAAVQLLRERDLGEPYAGGSDQAWWVSTAPGGAPIILGPDEPPQISISYSDELVAIALSKTFRVGVDIAASTPNQGEPADSELTERERAVLAETGDSQREWVFLRMWTQKEAVAKCLGKGSALPFAGIDTLGACPTGDQVAVTTDGSSVRLHQEVCEAGQQKHWLAVAWTELPHRS